MNVHRKHRSFMRYAGMGLSIAVLLSLAGCATWPGRPEPPGSARRPPGVAEVSREVQEPSPSGGRITPVGMSEEPEAVTPIQGASYRAEPVPRNQPVRPPAESARPEGPQEDRGIPLELAFDNADIYEVLDATLFQLFNVNYVIDPSIQANVTFNLKGTYTVMEYVDVLNDVLQLSNLAIVPGPGNLFKIVRKNLGAGTGTSTPLVGDTAEGPGDITRLVRLRYLSAGTAATNIRPFLSPGAVVVADATSNTLIITDTRANVNKVISIVNALDVNHIKEVSWRIIPLKHTESEAIATELTSVLSGQGLFNRPGVDPGSYQIHPIKSLNALLVASRWPSVLDLVGRWIGAMDQPTGAGTGVYVYFVQNGSAEELADILGYLYGGKTGSATRSKKEEETIVEPTREADSEAVGVSASVGAGELGGEVSFIADPTTNSIVIKASERDYRVVLGILEKLDIVPRQVLINVIIAEISLSGSVEYGVEWFLQGHRNDYTGQVILDSGISHGINTALGTGSGFTAAVFDGSDFLRGLIRALGKDASLNILSSPNIMASDHKEAYIEVAEEVPIVTGEVTSQEATTVTRSIQYRKTGIILGVTPHINSSGLVKMDISQEVSERGERDVQLQTTSIVSRKAETSLVVQDGQTIIIGGLMRNRDSVSRSGIPILRDIPVLGYVFGGQSTENSKTELIILISPRVVDNRDEAEAITREFSEKVSQVQKMIQAEEAKMK